MQQQVWRELFTPAASAAAAARINNSRHIVSGIWLRYFFKDHKSVPLFHTICDYLSVSATRVRRQRAKNLALTPATVKLVMLFF